MFLQKPLIHPKKKVCEAHSSWHGPPWRARSHILNRALEFLHIASCKYLLWPPLATASIVEELLRNGAGVEIIRSWWETCHKSCVQHSLFQTAFVRCQLWDWASQETYLSWNNEGELGFVFYIHRILSLLMFYRRTRGQRKRCWVSWLLSSTSRSCQNPFIQSSLISLRCHVSRVSILLIRWFDYITDKV